MSFSHESNFREGGFKLKPTSIMLEFNFPTDPRWILPETIAFLERTLNGSVFTFHLKFESLNNF